METWSPQQLTQRPLTFSGGLDSFGSNLPAASHRGAQFFKVYDQPVNFGIYSNTSKGLLFMRVYVKIRWPNIIWCASSRITKVRCPIGPWVLHFDPWFYIGPWAFETELFWGVLPLWRSGANSRTLWMSRMTTSRFRVTCLARPHKLLGCSPPWIQQSWTMGVCLEMMYESGKRWLTIGFFRQTRVFLRVSSETSVHVAQVPAAALQQPSAATSRDASLTSNAWDMAQKAQTNHQGGYGRYLIPTHDKALVWNRIQVWFMLNPCFLGGIWYWGVRNFHQDQKNTLPQPSGYSLGSSQFEGWGHQQKLRLSSHLYQ